MDKATEIKRRAQRCILNGDLSGALAEYEKLVAIGDPDPYYCVLLADLLYKMGSAPDAERRYLDAIEGYSRSGLYKNGIAVCKKLSRLALAPVEVPRWLAKLYSLDGLATEAGLAYQQLAEVLVKGDRVEEAREALQQALQVSPEAARLHERLGELEVLLGNNEAAGNAWSDAAERFERAGQESDVRRCRSRIAQLQLASPPRSAANTLHLEPSVAGLAPNTEPEWEAVAEEIDTRPLDISHGPPSPDGAVPSATDAIEMDDEPDAEGTPPVSVQHGFAGVGNGANGYASGHAMAPVDDDAAIEAADDDGDAPSDNATEDDDGTSLEPVVAPAESAPADTWADLGPVPVPGAPPLSFASLEPAGQDGPDAAEGATDHMPGLPLSIDPPVLRPTPAPPSDPVPEGPPILRTPVALPPAPVPAPLTPAPAPAFASELDVAPAPAAPPPVASPPAPAAPPPVASPPAPVEPPAMEMQQSAPVWNMSTSPAAPASPPAVASPPAPAAVNAAAEPAAPSLGIERFGDAASPERPGLGPSARAGDAPATPETPEDADLAHVSLILAEAQACFHAGDRDGATIALIRAAQAYDQMGRLDSAVAIYRSLGQSPDVSLQLMMLWLKNCQRRDDRAEAARVASDLGDRALNDGDIPGAREWFERARVYDPGNELANRRLDALNRPAGVAPADAPGREDHQPGAVGPAKTAGGQVSIRTQRDEPVIVDLGVLIEEFQRAIGPELASDPQGHYDLGMSYREMGLTEQAIEELRLAALAPAFRLRAGELGARCLLDLGRFDEAAEMFRDTLRVPDLSASAGIDLRYHLALALEAAGSLPEALEEFERVYSAQANYPDVAMKIRLLRKTAEAA